MKEDDVLPRIRELCRRKGWSVYKLAQESGINYSTLNNIFRRNNVPTISTLIKLTDGLEISLSAFFSDDTPAYTDKQKLLMQRYNDLPREDKKLLEAYLNGLEKREV
jgi:transcriptional regulator with XRE-family HTH domain